MGKRKRIKKHTVYGSIEGNREQLFFDILREIYKPKENGIHLTMRCSNGGTADSIVGEALKTCDRNKSFVWLDEDFEPAKSLGEEIRKKIARCWNLNLDDDDDAFLQCPLVKLQSEYNPKKRNPILIVSQPVCAEVMILRVLGYIPTISHYDCNIRKKQITDLKNQLNGLIERQDEQAFYMERLSKEILEAKRKEIPELDLLISMITVP